MSSSKVVIAAAISKEVRDRISEYAEEHGESMSNVICEVLDDYFKLIEKYDVDSYISSNKEIPLTPVRGSTKWKLEYVISQFFNSRLEISDDPIRTLNSLKKATVEAIIKSSEELELKIKANGNME